MEMKLLINLRILKLNLNRLKRIPVVIKSMNWIDELDLNDNPLEVPIEKHLVTLNSVDRIRGYLVDLEDGTKIWNECKVLILGQEVCCFSFYNFFDYLIEYLIEILK